ncbi:MAG: sulfotransferase [Anaerolineae bacterium]|nr:sulfotransferase [Anaerolineae bacterium]
MSQKAVTVVSGLPRSGTSLMMKMLESGGMEVLIDNVRQVDEDNPQGYYEFEKVKQIKEDQAWLEDARGKVVKMVSALLKHLPGDHAYKVIFMRRKMEEILASQKRMLVRREEPTDKASDEAMAAWFHKHLKKVEAWLASQPNIDVIYVSYNETLEDPVQQAKRVNQFLGNALDEEKMVGVVDPTLYRQRR